jgi:hypothetical protein
MKIAIVGSRDFANEELVRAFVRSLATKDPNAWVISGGARGVDDWAATEAIRCCVSVTEHLPDWETYGKGAGFIRNSKILEEAEAVVAFWDGYSKGTLDTIKKAYQKGLKLTVLDASGKEFQLSSIFNGVTKNAKTK